MSPVMLPATSPRATVPITSLAKLPPEAREWENTMPPRVGRVPVPAWKRLVCTFSLEDEV